MKTIIFSPAVYNLAETTRALEIAKVCCHMFDILFISYGGNFENLIEEEGFKIERLKPKLTPEKIDHLYKVDQSQASGSFFSIEEIDEQVNNEIEIFDKVKPVAVVTGWNFSNSISCRVKNVPLIWLTQSTWMYQSYYKAGLGTYVDMLDIPIIRWFPDRFLTWVTRKCFTLYDKQVRPYNKIAKKHGTKLFESMEQLWEGDYNLLAEPTGFCELDFPTTYHCIGPLIGRLDSPVPEEILNMPRDKPIIYFAMGSSGQSKIIAKIIESFEGKPYRIISPVKMLLGNTEIKVPSNVYLTGWIPSHKVNPMADISVIHGGIGTTMTACLAGTPIIGIGMQPEQEFNIDCIVRKGFAIRIRKNRLSAETLLHAIDKLLKNKKAKKRAEKFQKELQEWNSSLMVENFFKNTFKPKA